MSGLLDGLRVVELGVWVAGPGAGGVLADWGADVVKVEPPAGDPMRKLFAAYAGIAVDGNPPFDLDNRGKRSVVLDLEAEDGRAAMRALVATADVFLSNLRPDALERMGLDHVTLLASHPRLVYASVTGFGLEGPERDRAAYDVGAFWARTGIPYLLVPKGSEPPGIRGGLGDHVTGLATVAGVLAALRVRDRTGQGQLVSTSLLRAGIYSVGWDIGIQLRYGRLQSTRGRKVAPNPCLNSYQCADDKWLFLIGLEADRHWPKLATAMGHPEWREEERFATARTRAENCAALIELLDSEFAIRDRAEWAKRFDEHDVWWAPVNTPAEVVEDPQAIAAGAFVDVPGQPGPEGEPGEPFKAVATPVTFGSAAVGPPGPVPRLGEHTDEVLAELGLR